jgi:hypothetical protein
MFKKFVIIFGLTLTLCFLHLTPSIFAVEIPEEPPVVIRYARPLSMGGAFLCVTDDQNSFFYNPAGIMQRKDFLMTLVEMPLQITDDMTNFYNFFVDNKDDFENFTTLGETRKQELINKIIKSITKYRVHFTLGLPNANLIFKSNGRWNLAGGLFTIFDMRAKINSGVLVPTIDLWGSVDGAMFFTYARRWINIRDQSLSVGINAKFIVRSKFDEKRKSLLALDAIDFKPQFGMGIGFDLGCLAEITPKWRAGLMIRDLFDTKITYQEITSGGVPKPAGSSKIPRQVNLGIAYKPLSFVTLAADVEDITKKNAFTDEFFTHLHLGAEVGWKMMRIRGGFNQGYPTFGFGIYTPILLDIEYTYYSTELGKFAGQIPETNHMLALALRF